MERKSKVINVSLGEQWSNDYGTFYPFSIEFENGDKGVYNSKSDSQSKFVINQITDYIIETKGNNTFIKAAQQNNFIGGGKPKISQEQWDKLNAAKALADMKKQYMIIQQSCIGYSIEMCKACDIKPDIEAVINFKDQLVKNILSETKKTFNGSK